MLALCWSWASDRHGDHIQVVEMIPIFVSTATTWRCGITSVTWWDPITDVTVPHGPKSTGLCFGCLVARNGCHSNTTSLAAAQRCPTHLGPQKTCRVAPSNCFVHTIPARASPSQLSAKKRWDMLGSSESSAFTFHIHLWSSAIADFAPVGEWSCAPPNECLPAGSRKTWPCSLSGANGN